MEELEGRTIEAPDRHGEVHSMDLPTAAEELAHVQVKLEQAMESAKQLGDIRAALVQRLEAELGTDTPITLHSLGMAVTLVAKEGKRQVHTGVCDEYREQLLQVGASKPKPPPPLSYTNPTVAELDDPATRARIAAAGVPVARLVHRNPGHTVAVLTNLEG